MTKSPSTLEKGGDLAALRALSDAARRVEAAYSKLRHGAARLDQELADANRRLEQKVVELEHLSGSLAAVLSAIPCGVVVADGDGVVIMANPAAQRILGVSQKDLLGRPAASVVDENGQKLLLLPRGECSDIERPVASPDSKEGARIVRGSVVAVKDAAGEFLGRVELLDDRTEVKTLEEEVRRLDRLAELGRVAAILAHEIRNPLSGIRGFAGMLERKLKDGDGRESELRYARRICEGADRADAIIDSVLFLARPRPLRHETVDVESFFCDCWESVAHADPARARGVEVKLDVSPRGLAIHADRVRLAQGVSNLLTNALHATSSTGGKGHIELSARVNGEFMTLRIADDGPGIDRESLPHLFEPFFTTKSEGAGLGLALVQRVAELHGGKVRVTSEKGKGAAFCLDLPMHKNLETETACA